MPRRFFARFENVLFDYPVVAQWTQTLQNRTCFFCDRMTGEFHWYTNATDKRRSARGSAALVAEAKRLHPSSRNAQANWLRPHGLHPAANPCDDIPGLDIFQGVTFTPLHMIYEGNLQTFIERAFQMLQADLSVLVFNKVGCDCEIECREIMPSMLRDHAETSCREIMPGARAIMPRHHA